MSRLIDSLRKGLLDFAGFGPTTLLWPRWVFLRLLGVVYVFSFAYWCKEGTTLVGPEGLEPIQGYLDFLTQNHGVLARIAYVPTLFWLGAGATALNLAAWTGLVAALALTFNLWPRAALAVCAVLFISFIAPLTDFCPTLVDPLLIEMSLLAIPFAPKGLRPGLGHDSPPHRLAVLALRLFTFRVLFESGYGKVASDDPIVRGGFLMDVMHSTTPFPNTLGFLDHQLPHAWHTLELYFTYAAELGSAFLILLGRGPRLVAICLWTALQSTILLTSNFGPLNVLAITLGLTLLDDQRIESLLGRKFAAPANVTPRPDPRWQLRSWALIWVPNVVSGTILFAFALFRVPFDQVPDWAVGLYRNGSIAGQYTLYEGITPYRVLVEYAGSDDYGKSWKPYPYKYVIQDERSMSGLIAPYFPRFDVAIQAFSQPNACKKRLLYLATARHLLEGDQAVLGLFAGNPFPARPPQAIRISSYRLEMSSWADYRSTGQFWKRTFVDDMYKALVRDPQTGRIHFEN